MLQHTTMAVAFANARLPKVITKNTAALVRKVGDSLDRYAKGRKLSKDWTARLSFRTARYLASKGVPLQ